MSWRLVRTTAVLGLLGVVTACAGTGSGPHRDAGRSSGRIQVSPAIVQQGRHAAAADHARVVVTARFPHVGRGHRITVERRTVGTGWQDVASLGADGHGAVRHVEQARDRHGRAYSYRAVLAPGPGQPRAHTPAGSAARWKLRFSDEFTGHRLDTARWSYRGLGGYSPASDRACSASGADAVHVAGGHLVLRAFENTARMAQGPCTAQDGNNRADQRWFENSQVSTPGNGFRFRYGYAAARVRFDHRRGAHGSFWLLSTTYPRAGRGPRSNGAEIDVVEYFGDRFAKWHSPKSVYSFVYYRTPEGRRVKVPSDDDPEQPIPRDAAGLSARDSWSKSYHVFSVLWTPARYVFFVDGVPTRSIARGVSHVPEAPILSMLTSGWEVSRFRPGADLHTDVDWVRVWQLPGWSCSGAPRC